MKVKQAMHKNAEWRDPATPIADIARLMRDEDIGAVPIGENDRLIGMVTDRDIACRAVADGADPKTCTAGDIMSSGIFYTKEDDDLDDAIELMEEKKVRRLAVINGQKRLVGILSLGDVSYAASLNESGHLAQAVSAHH